MTISSIKASSAAAAQRRGHTPFARNPRALKSMSVSNDKFEKISEAKRDCLLRKAQEYAWKSKPRSFLFDRGANQEAIDAYVRLGWKDNVYEQMAYRLSHEVAGVPIRFYWLPFRLLVNVRKSTSELLTQTLKLIPEGCAKSPIAIELAATLLAHPLNKEQRQIVRDSVAPSFFTTAWNCPPGHNQYRLALHKCLIALKRDPENRDVAHKIEVILESQFNSKTWVSAPRSISIDSPV